MEAGAELGTKDRAEDATPLGWAEYAQGSTDRGNGAKQYSEIVAYLRAKGAPA